MKLNELKNLTGVKVQKQRLNNSLKKSETKSSIPQAKNPQNLSALYKTNFVSFARKWSEHKSWGAVVDSETKDVSFKLFTFPDVKSVKVVVEKKDSNKTFTFELKNKGKGIFETEKPISKKYAKDGDSYYYEIEKRPVYCPGQSGEYLRCSGLHSQ